MLSWQMPLQLKVAGQNKASSGIKTGVQVKSPLPASRNAPGNQVSIVPVVHAAALSCTVND